MAFLRESEYDEFTGVTKNWYFDGDKIVCHKTYDESFLLDATKAQANMTIDSTFINDSHMMHKMASIPPIIVEKILTEHGINMLGELTPAEQLKLRRIIETEYPLCKTHTKKLWIPR